jgi:hypothetical protein
MIVCLVLFAVIIERLGLYESNHTEFWALIGLFILSNILSYVKGVEKKK